MDKKERIIYFEDEMELFYDVMSLEDSEPFVTVIADHALIWDFAIELFNSFEYTPGMMDFDLSSYDRELLLSVDFKEKTVEIEEAYMKDIGVYKGASGIVYIHDLVNSKCVNDLKNNQYVNPKLIVFTFDDDYESLEDDCDDHQSCMNWDEDKRGFTYCECCGDSRSKFAYRGNRELSTEDAYAIIRAYIK